MKTKKRYPITFIAMAACIGSVNATIIASTSKINQSDAAPTASSTDLGQTAALSYSATGTQDFLGNIYVAYPGPPPEVLQLFNGEVGNTDSDSNDPGEVNIVQGGSGSSSTFTVNFDLSANTLGYDITEIYSVAGWNTTGGGRSNQGYQIDLVFADFSTATLIDGTWEANNPQEYWTTVSLTNDGGGVLTEGLVSATGVRSITFSNFDNARAGGFTIYREFDIIGVATIPEPSTFALLGLAGLAVMSLRRQR